MYKRQVKNGADEIDMVINIGLVKAGHYDQVPVSYTHLDVYKRQAGNWL